LRAFFTAIWVLLVAIISTLLMLLPLVDGVESLLHNTIGFIQGNFTFAVVFALITGFSLWLFAGQFRGAQRSPMPSSVVLQVEDGEVRIALAAIDTLVQQAAKEIRGVREVRTDFFTRNEGLGVYIKTVVSADGSIPELSAQLQRVVMDHVHRIAGINIEEVKVLVENVSTASRNRVELR